MRSKKADRVARRLHGLLNEERQKRGLSRLEGSQALIQSAEKHSQSMAAKGELFHPKNINNSKLGYKFVYENCAKTHRSGSTSEIAHRLKDQWLDSDAHRSSLLEEGLRYDGIGIWFDGSDVYATHRFAEKKYLSFNKNLRWLVHQLFQLPQKASKTSYQAGLNIITWILPTRQLSISERQVVAGVLYGGTAVAVAVMATGLEGSVLSRLAELATMHSIQRFNFQSIIRGIIESGMQPLGLALIISGTLSTVTVSDTTRLRYSVLNSIPAGIGYVTYISIGMFATTSLSFGTLLPVGISAVTLASVGGVIVWTSRLLRKDFRQDRK